MSDDQFHAILPSPLGPITLIGTVRGLAGLYLQDPPPLGESAAHDGRLDQPIRQLEEYLDGRRQEFDLQLDLRGTAFQLRVWSELRSIPFGQTISYGELARRVGLPNGSRAVGQANGQNPVSIVVPCHRVIGANGKLTGYGGGMERKRWLLDFEARDRLPFR